MNILLEVLAGAGTGLLIALAFFWAWCGWPFSVQWRRETRTLRDEPTKRHAERDMFSTYGEFEDD